MSLISTTCGKSFPINAGETLLDAAARAGVVIPYSCRTGRCSTCMCKVLSGNTTAKTDEIGLSAAEREQGWVLSCVRSAESDVVIDVDELTNTTLPPIKTLPCRIVSIEKLAPDVVEVVLRTPPTAEFSFLPGQYVDVIGPAGLRRSYSLASADVSQKLLTLHVRAVDRGVMSAYWFDQAKVNDLLRFNGPLGTFFLRETRGIDLVFLATGTGIAPVKAMVESIRHLPDQLRPASIRVYWGGRRREDLYWDVSAIRAVLGAGQVFDFIPVLSKGDDAWSGARGYVQNVLLADQLDLSDTFVYACGSDAMIHSARSALISAGLPHRRFLSDAFVSSSAN